MEVLPNKVDVVVVGGGQAGIAASEHLRSHNILHVVLEKDRLAESWRSRRWDSLVANGPAWHDRFPSLEFKGPQDAFAPKDLIVEYMEQYAKQIKMPFFSNVEVTGVERRLGTTGFLVKTSKGAVDCEYVIAATGAFQIPVVPTMIPETSDLMQLHSLYYKSPSQLPKGNVLVVGAGSSGAQIAEELSLVGDGRKIFLSVGGHNRPPRSYRGRDFCWWLGVLNEWDDEATENNKHVTIAVSGARGGQTMDFRRLAAQGITLLGHADGFAGGKVLISNDLRENIRRGDENYLSVLDQADEFIARNGLDLPEEPEARDFLPDPSCLVDPVLELDLEANGITSIIWATGFRNDYSWISSTKALGSAKKPSHRRGVSDEPGIYFLGLPWQTRRGSSFIWGVWHDAKHVADHIAKQRGYAMYRPGVVKN